MAAPRSKLLAAALRLTADSRGGTALIYAITLPVIVGFIGLGVEVGGWYLARQKLQNAADSAAFAAALTVQQGGDNAAATAAALAAVRRSGYGGATDPVPVVEGPGIVDPSLPAAVQAGAVRVRLSEAQQLLFSDVLRDDGVVVNVASIGAAGKYSVSNCIVGLDTTSGVNAVDINGASFTAPAGCGVHSNSNMVVSGNNASIAAMAVSTSGTYSGVAPDTLSQNAQPYSDPYAGTTYTSSPTCTHSKLDLTEYDARTRTDRTFVFCGTNSIDSNTTFHGPAVYVFDGAFDIKGATTVTATEGVTFVFVNTKTIKVTGSATINISAPTQAQVDALSGDAKAALTPWIGIAMYGKPTSPTADYDFGGSVTLNADGVLLFPSTNLTFQGNLSSGTSQCLRVYGNRVRTNGGVSMGGNNCSPYSVKSTSRIRPALYK